MRPSSLCFTYVLVIFCSAPLADFVPDELIVWNVGQGSFNTIVAENECHHFDAGGERRPPRALDILCENLKNRIWLSHWDLDHVSFVRNLTLRLRSVVQLTLPVLPAHSILTKKIDLLSRQINSNQKIEPARVASELEGQCRLTPNRLRKRFDSKIYNRPRSSNQSSRAYVQRHILFPGDATKTEEQCWVSRSRKKLSEVEVLIVGHHGSKTSTGPFLLSALTNLRLSIASARRKKYGHPHKEVVERLRARGIPVLTTEAWGNIHVRL